MTKKLALNSVEQALNRISRPSVMDRIINEIDAAEIPAKYISNMSVIFEDGTVIALSGADLKNQDQASPAMVSWAIMRETFKAMVDIKIFINTSLLEKDVDVMVGDLLDRFC